eukprot:CAMPEP_0194570454 /NCGR_PEP_ID=MMETSP0292-20121207/7750_1 /TAXON_ID=39354 /ORGANISM="Heterosigma akashiwo, Strain CCMP2393" /LENGTH=54 /DNA_ID=CAMNT_0039420881 /DNA_START=468 /DNA_END=632 /DNA_ORIENTATION=+
MNNLEAGAVTLNPTTTGLKQLQAIVNMRSNEVYRRPLLPDFMISQRIATKRTTS